MWRVRLLAQLGKDVRRKGAVDGTVYGTAATSTRSFSVHHLSAVAAGVKHADALTPDNAAAPLSSFDTRPAEARPPAPLERTPQGARTRPRPARVSRCVTRLRAGRTPR